MKKLYRIICTKLILTFKETHFNISSHFSLLKVLLKKFKVTLNCWSPYNYSIVVLIKNYSTIISYRDKDKF